MPLARQRYGEPWQDDPDGSHEGATSEHLKGRASPEADGEERCCKGKGRHTRRETSQEGASICHWLAWLANGEPCEPDWSQEGAMSEHLKGCHGKRHSMLSTLGANT